MSREQSERMSDCCNVFGFTNDDLIGSGFYRTKTFNNLVCCLCAWETPSATNLTIQHLNFLHKLSNPDCEMSKYTKGNFKDYYFQKKSTNYTEELMRQSFLSWPHAYPTINEMVNVGFYYTGIEDDVCCIECAIILNDWLKEDKPFEEHKKASPYCKLMLLYDYNKTVYK